MKRIICSVLMAVVLAVSVFAVDVPYTQFYKAADLALDGSAVVASAAEGSINDKVLICNEKGDNASGTGFSFTFTVPEDGNYTIWGRVFYPSQSNNSIHYSVDGGDSLIWDFPDEDDTPGETDPSLMPVCYGSWQYFYLTYRQDGTFTDTNMQGWWSIENNQWRHAPNVLNLKAGEHTIHFVGRETGWMIDEFVVTELPVEEYDPNFYSGNNAILDPCQFCGTYWQHYYEDIYAATGVTAEQYYNETLYPIAETVTDTAGDPASAPQTMDITVVLAACAALTGTIVSRKRR